MSTATPEDDAPPRPSTWQLLFGANKKRSPLATTDNQHDEDAVQPQTRSPTAADVSAQLLKALQSRSNATQDDAIGRQCSDELLGKPNAFAPHWRGTDDSDRIARTNEAQQQARELIRTRLQVDQRADAIRRGKTREQLRRDDSRVRAPTRAERQPRGVETGMAERLERLREIQARRERDDKAREHDRLRREKLEHLEHRPKRQPMERAKTTAKVTEGARATVVTPRATAKVAPLTTKATTAARRPKSSNQDETGAVESSAPSHAKAAPAGRDLRVLDDKLRALQAENQRAAELDDRLRAQHHALRIKRCVWALWQQRVAKRQRHEASVARAFEWRTLQRVWAAWRREARAASSDRAARLAREQLVRDKRQHDKATQFYRTRHLVVWFQRWRAEALAARDARRLEAEIQRRRDQAARLVERFARGPTAQGSISPHEHGDHGDHGADNPHRLSSPSRVPRPRAKPTPADEATRSKPAVKQAWVSPPEPTGVVVAARRSSPERTPSSSSPSSSVQVHGPPPTKPKTSTSPPDAFYVAMLERTEQRKAQREQLRLKYERLEQEKREALARQVAEREALLERQKQQERERVRAKKREEARLARDKAAQRHVAAIQQQSAALHDRLRLLYHYAFRPWQEAWRASTRVARNAAAWHALRVGHKTWHAWCSFVRVRRAQRRLAEQERMAVAANHHRDVLLRSVLVTWKLAQRDTQQRQLAVQRLVQWNATRRAWRRWHHAYALVLGDAQQRERHARRALERRRVRGFLAAWREAAVEAKRERVRLAEKELLWKKARMWLNE